MSEPKSQKSQIEKWTEVCQYVDDLVKTCPALTDGELLNEWYQEVHGWLVHLGQCLAESEALYALVFAKTLEIDDVSETAFKYIKGSSTSLSLYISGKHNEEYKIWQRIKNLNRNLETILYDMRTQLVNLREADNRDNMTSQNQRQQQQTTTGNNPSVTDDAGWPKYQSAR